jgi:hypothetical protein
MPKRGGSKGRVKLSLRHLARERPSPEDFETIMDGLDNMEARAMALVLSALVEAHLEQALMMAFVPIGQPEYDRLFANPGAPLSDFSSKIALGHALGIYVDEFRRQLDCFRTIRNAFAHAMLQIDFSHPLIVEHCNKLDLSKLTATWTTPKSHLPARMVFKSFGILAGTHFEIYCEQASEQPARVPFRSKYA